MGEYLEKQLLEYASKDGKLVPQRCTEAMLQKHGFLHYVLSRYDDNSADLENERKLYISETLYRILNNIGNAPRCKACGKPIKFKGFYSLFCSRKCSNSDIEVKSKNASSVSKSLKAAYEKRKDSILSKRKSTLERRFGESLKSATPFASKEAQSTARATMLFKYGVDNWYKSGEAKERRKSAAIEKSIELWKSRGYDIEYIGDNVIVKNACKLHGNVAYTIKEFNQRFSSFNGHNTEVKCKICNPFGRHTSEIEAKVKAFLDEHSIEYIQHCRSMIKGYELDFYLPKQRIGIECNGMYWHSENSGIDRMYHQKKTLAFKEIGVQVLHIWEDDLILKNSIVQSMLMAKLGLSKQRIYARDCIVKEVSSKDAKAFLEENHLQGNAIAKHRLALYYKGELVALMTFCKLRASLGQKHEEGAYELLRFCNKKEMHVIGGASKLLAYFKKNFAWKKIITYAKIDYSNGRLYEKLGFKFEKICSPNYYWVDRKLLIRENRYKYRKSEIRDDSNGNMSERQIMESRGFFRIWDSGNLKYSISN